MFGAEIRRVATRVPRGRVEVVAAVAPVGERHVVVDADEVDRGVRPQRVEMEINVAGTVGGLVAEVLAPVGAVRNLRARAEHGPHVVGER